MVMHRADGRNTVLDYREIASKAAHRDMYIGKDGKPIPRLSDQGYKAIGVPGVLAGMDYVSKNFWFPAP